MCPLISLIKHLWILEVYKSNGPRVVVGVLSFIFIKDKQTKKLYDSDAKNLPILFKYLKFLFYDSV